MTDNEIIKALELHSAPQDACVNKCPYGRERYCGSKMAKDALDLINRQRAEIEELKSDVAMLKESNINLQDLYQNQKEKVSRAKQKVIDAFKTLETAKAEANKEFAERLKLKVDIDLCEAIECSEYLYNLPKLIDDLAKEVTEGKE